jgi:hypothetical protein
MRVIFLLLALGGAAWSQALTEGAAAVAGGAVGGAAGKKVGEGVAHVLDKVAGTAAKAADDKDSKQAKAAPALEVGTGVPKVGTSTVVSSTSGASPSGSSQSGSGKRAVSKAPKPDRSLVPPPPPPAHQAVAKVEPPSAPQAVVEEVVAPPLPPPPPPEVTADDLKSLANGMGRLAVLKLGSPASRITMADSGHLVEIYSYAKHDKNFGVVRLSDGVVSSIEIRP